MGKPTAEGERRIKDAIEEFNSIIDTVENRCLHNDGPVTPTLQEITEEELAALWRSLQSIHTALQGSSADNRPSSPAQADKFDDFAFRKLLDDHPYGKPRDVEHDGFSGSVIGYYVTREGKPGVVLQQNDTRVVHVYGEKWFDIKALMNAEDC